MNDIKTLYWNLESFIFEVFTKIRPIKQPKKKHQLPNQLIVSLTSYPPRFGKLYLTVKCLITQSISADKIILCVAECDYKSLPESILLLENSIDKFEITTSEDIGAYKKIIPVLKEYPNAFIVTADDDVYYPKEWLDKLITEWDSSYKSIFAHRVHEITYKNKSIPESYNKWNMSIKEQKNFVDYLATGIGGVFYPPGSLHSQSTNIDKFMDLCPNADDIWLFWMARLNNSCTKKTSYNFNTISWLDSQGVALAGQNVNKNQNDVRIQNLINNLGWPIK